MLTLSPGSQTIMRVDALKDLAAKSCPYMYLTFPSLSRMYMLPRVKVSIVLT